jgi:hypothetical protein
MAGSTTKKVQIWRFDRETLSGFVNPLTYLTDSGVELLTLAGNVSVSKYTEIKAVIFVREFDAASEALPARRTFLSRPKLDGLWLRLTFRDGDVQEAVMPNNLLQVEPLGFNLIPPETTHRLWIPRQALTAVQVLGVIGGRAAAAKRSQPTPREQIGLFEQG